MRYLFIMIVGLLIGCGSGGSKSSPPPTQEPPVAQPPVTHDKDAFAQLEVDFSVEQGVFELAFEDRWSAEWASLTSRGLSRSSYAVKQFEAMFSEEMQELTDRLSAAAISVNRPLERGLLTRLFDIHSDLTKEFLLKSHGGFTIYLAQSVIPKMEKEIEDAFAVAKLNIQ